jgi:hypothetical protein
MPAKVCITAEGGYGDEPKEGKAVKKEQSIDAKKGGMQKIQGIEHQSLGLGAVPNILKQPVSLGQPEGIGKIIGLVGYINAEKQANQLCRSQKKDLRKSSASSPKMKRCSLFMPGRLSPNLSILPVR